MARSATSYGRILRYLTLFLVLRGLDCVKSKTGKWKKKKAKKAAAQANFPVFTRNVNPERPIGKIPSDCNTLSRSKLINN